MSVYPENKNDDGKDKMWIADLKTMMLHRADCPKIPEDGILEEYEDIALFAELPNARFCDCSRGVWYRLRVSRNVEFINEQSNIGFVHVKGSKVFHRKDCPCALAGVEIETFARHKTGVKLGYTPCKRCKPASIFDLGQTEEEYREKQREARKRRQLRKKLQAERLLKVTKKKKPQNIKISMLTKEKYDVPERTMSKPEIAAVRRFVSAKEERIKLFGTEALTDQQRIDLITKSRADFAFWAATGYSTFHTHDCPKLKKMEELRGFHRYEDAVRAGYKPCKVCKPSQKTSLLLTMPIYSTFREGEGIDGLKAICEEKGLAYRQVEDLFEIATDVGIWRIDYSSLPYRLYHINKVVEPENETDFHQQPRVFLSLGDIVFYVKQHDDLLKKRTEGEGDKWLVIPRVRT